MHPAITVTKVLAPFVVQIVTKSFQHVSQKKAEMLNAKIKGGVDVANTLANSFTSYSNTSTQSESDIRRAELQSQAILEKIKSDKEVFMKVLDLSFKKQDKLIDSSLDMINKAIETNNIELLNNSFGLLRDVAAQSLFDLPNFEEVQKRLGTSDFPMVEFGKENE